MINHITKYIRKKFGPIKHRAENIWRFFLEAKSLFFKLVKHNASMKTETSKMKMQYSLLRENHTIEKGMSMKNPRKGFGQEKVLILLQRLNLYYVKYKDKTFIRYPIITLKSYIELTKNNGVDISFIESEFNKLCILSEIDINKVEVKAATKEVKKESILLYSKINFENFVNVRHSIRYFSNKIPEINLITKALEIAQHTPSACNRQGWFTYILQYDKTQKLLAWQGGAKGFEKDIPMSILITTNMNAFLSWEPYQTYVDGGMYAMSLIYALHSQGLGTIPLSTGFEAKRIKQLHIEFNIPESEVPIVIVGVGCLLDKFNVAVSERKPIEQTTIYL